MSDDEILTKWYQYAANQAGFIGDELRMIRDRLDITIQQQIDEFGANQKMFLQLQAMPIPRAKSFSSDALRIAETCELLNPLALVRTLILARNLRRMPIGLSVQEAYQAAFDATVDLDDLPEEE